MEVAALEAGEPQEVGSMKNQKYKILTQEEKNKIENKIFEIEKKTSGEIVIIFTRKSDEYKYFQNLTSTILALLFSLIITYYLPEILLNIMRFKEETLLLFIKYNFSIKKELRYLFTIGLWFFLPIYLFLYFSFKCLFSTYPSLLKYFIPEFYKTVAVKKNAFTKFYEHKLYKTRDETGILFLISLFERKLYILADRGIYNKISQNTLDEYAKKLSKGIKEKKTAESLIEIIDEIGNILEKNFPIKSDDINELPNAVIFE